MKELSRLIIISVVCIGLGEPLLASQAMVRKDTEFDEIGDVYKKVCQSQESVESEVPEVEPFVFEDNNTFLSPDSSTDLLLSAVDIGLLGSVKALFSRGENYLVGTPTISQDFYKAFQCFERAAPYGHADALYNLGLLYFKGKGVDINLDKALECFAEAARLGYKPTYKQLHEVGLCFAAYTEGAQDYQKVKSCSEQAMQREITGVYRFLGALYLNGQGVEKNLDEALKYFTKVAQLGGKDAYLAIFTIGTYFAEGTGVTQDDKKAVSCYKLVIEGNVVGLYVVIAYYNLAISYLKGKGVEKNLDEALKYFTKAAQLGEKDAYRAICRIGTYFAEGTGVTQDYKKAVSCYKLVIEGDVVGQYVVNAYYNVALSYLNGEGVEKNLDEALKYFMKAAQLGDKDAYGDITNIGFCFSRGKGVTQDYKKAVGCYEQAALRGKVPVAYNNLGLLYLHGRGVDKNLDKALEYFEQAAQLGDKDAYGDINHIGFCFGTGTGVTQDYKKAVGCYEQAALHGKVPVAYNNLGLLYLNGQGVEKNVDKALEYFVQAAQLGCKNAYGKIEDIGFYFVTGTGVTQDYKKAVSCYEQALPGKTSLAHCSLGVMYLNGWGVEKNFDKALEYFVQAAQLGFKDAYAHINYMGACFARGTGVTQDYKKAVSCFEQAIQGKVPVAYYSLGIVYLKGQGVEKNLDKALELWTQAAELGYQDACVAVYHCFAKGIRVQKDEKRAAAYLKKIAETLGEQEAKKRVDERFDWFLSDDPKINCVGEMSVCPICTNKFAQGDAITILACSSQALHIFCKDCLEGWRTTCGTQGRPLSCPCCRSINASVLQGHAF